MKRRAVLRTLGLLGVLVAVALTTLGCVQSEPEVIVIQPRPYPERPSIAVIEFENRTGYDGLGWGLADMLESALIRTQRYDVVSRRQWDAILEEQMRQDAFVDPRSAARTGRLLGVKYLITGSVNQALVEPVDLSLPGFEFYGTQASVGVTLQVIDVETGRIIDAPEAYGTATSAKITVDTVQVGSARWSSSLLGRASRDAIDKLVNKLVYSF